jgi:GTP-binding protein Era
MRSGFVSILGRPNAGKSTLVNALVGEKISIVTSKPQTTRHRVSGIVSVPERKGHHPPAQIVFVDTPGVLTPGSELDRRMMQEVMSALEQRDIVLMLVDASRRIALGAAENAQDNRTPTSEDEYLFQLVRKLDCPVFLVLNKIDLVERAKLLPLITQLSEQYKFAEVVPISARKKDGLRVLLHKLAEYLPEGKRHFPEEQYTDQPERFIASELIREQILLETGEEVPYASAVVIERWEEPEPPRKLKKGILPKLPLTRIAAAIYCERDGQKAIIIGKGGSKLKAIGAAARKQIESLIGTRVFLELHVIVQQNWRESRAFVDHLDWRRQMEELINKGKPEEAWRKGF